MRRFADAFWAALKLLAIIAIVWLGFNETLRTVLRQAPLELSDNDRDIDYTPLPGNVALELFETEVYGHVPIPSVSVAAYEVLDSEALDGLARLVQWTVDLDYPGGTRSMDMVALLPNASDDYPVILTQNFCPNPAVIPLPGVKSPGGSSFCGSDTMMTSVMTFFFGRYIATPPLEDILSCGYGLAAIYPHQVIPDTGRGGLEALETLFPQERTRPGALSVWTGLFDVMADLVEEEAGARPIVALGHSRFGKTALMAAAWSEKIDGAIAHQSGTLGASSMTDRYGEPLSSLVRGYPHWPSRAIGPYADRPASLPVRPADLLAAVGDKPVLLGNARRDVWSDPYGAFTEAKAGFGDTMSATSLYGFVPTDRHAFWMRPGTHGVVEEDWPAFLDFLDANFKN